VALISKERAGRWAGLRALRWVLPWVWAIRGARATYAAGLHVHGRLTPVERKRLAALAWKSRGLRRNLTLTEQIELRRLFNKVDVRDTVRAVAAEFSPLPWPRPPR
jgi:hypothetical protein